MCLLRMFYLAHFHSFLSEFQSGYILPDYTEFGDKGPFKLPSISLASQGSASEKQTLLFHTSLSLSLLPLHPLHCFSTNSHLTPISSVCLFTPLRIATFHIHLSPGSLSSFSPHLSLPPASVEQEEQG